MQLDPLIKKDLADRANRLAGLMQTFATEVKQNGKAEDILHLLITIVGCYEKLLLKIDDAIRMHLNIILHTPLPHDKETEDLRQYLENLRLQLPKTTLRQFPEILKQLRLRKIID